MTASNPNLNQASTASAYPGDSAASKVFGNAVSPAIFLCGTFFASDRDSTALGRCELGMQGDGCVALEPNDEFTRFAISKGFKLLTI